MSLHSQILVIIVSFFFGIFFEIFHCINYKLIYNKRKIVKILFTFLLVFIQSLIYFYLLTKINNGIIHLYGILSIVVGILLFYFLKKTVSTFYKKHKR